MKLGICVFAIGKEYNDRFPFLVSSAAEHLKIEHEFYLFTDDVGKFDLGQKDIFVPPCEHPYGTLMRWHSMLGWKEKLISDYLFLMDVDMKFVSDVGEEILSPLTAVERSMFTLRWGWTAPFEPNPESAAYIRKQGYYCGGMIGGERERFLELGKKITRGIDHDFGKGYISIWHDESHLNKLLNTEFIPAKVLDPGYCYPPDMLDYYRTIWGKDYEAKIQEVKKEWKITKESREQTKKDLKNFVPKAETIKKFYNQEHYVKDRV